MSPRSPLSLSRAPISLILALSLAAPPPSLSWAAASLAGAGSTAAPPPYAGSAVAMSRLAAVSPGRVPVLYDGVLPSAPAAAKPRLAPPPVGRSRAVSRSPLPAKVRAWEAEATRALEDGRKREAELWALAARSRGRAGASSAKLDIALRSFIYKGLSDGLGTNGGSSSWARWQAKRLGLVGCRSGMEKAYTGWIDRHLSGSRWNRTAAARARGALPKLRQFLGIAEAPSQAVLIRRHQEAAKESRAPGAAQPAERKRPSPQTPAAGSRREAVAPPVRSRGGASASSGPESRPVAGETLGPRTAPSSVPAAPAAPPSKDPVESAFQTASAAAGYTAPVERVFHAPITRGGEVPGAPPPAAASAMSPRRAAKDVMFRSKLYRELATVRSNEAALSASAAETEAALRRAEEGGLPEEAATALREKLERDLSDLKANRERAYLLSKLAEKADLMGSTGRAGELAALDDLMRLYDGSVGAGDRAPGRVDAVDFSRAALEALRKRLEDSLSDAGAAPAAPALDESPYSGTPLERSLAERVARVEELKARAQAELGERDAAGRLLAVADRMRAGSLRRRRDERDMMEFRKNFARLAMVMDLSYSLNMILAAEEAIARMRTLLEDRLEAIKARRDRSSQEAQDARENGERVPEWEQDVRENVASSEENEGLFTELGEQAGMFVDRLEDYRADVRSLLELIDARDRGESANAIAEYNRRIALLPVIRQYRETGYPDDDGSVTKLSMSRLRSESARVDDYLFKVRDGESKIDGAPVEFAGVLVIAVPGIPAAAVSNPTAGQTLAMLDDRREFWLDQRADFQALLDSVQASLSSGNSKRVLDDFGDPVPESLVVYLREERQALEEARRDAQRFGREIDALAAKIAAVGAGNLPALAGQDAAALRNLIPAYADQLETLNFPDTHEGLIAQIEKIGIARLLPFLGDTVVKWAKAEAAIEILEDAISGPLPEARTRFQEAVDAIDTVLSDIELDRAYVNAGAPASQGQALIDRKRALVSSTLKPMLERMKTFIGGTLIPFQQDQIDSMDPDAPGDSYAVLYREKINLFERIDESYEETTPWGLASWGAPKGNTAAAKANIDAKRVDFQEYKQMVADYQDEIRRRTDPDNTEMEDVYGEAMPYSLPRRIEQYSAETARRAGQINSLSAEINSILGELDGLTGGQYGLRADYSMPTDIQAGDEASLSRLNALVDSRRIQDLADILRRIGDEALAGGSGDMDIGGGEGLPEGEQPPVDISEGQRTAVLALDAVKRLVPSTQASTGDSLTECIARYLFTGAVVDASRESLETQIPVFKPYLDKAAAALDRVFADLDADEDFVSSRSETPEAFFERKIRIFTELRDIANEGARLFKQKAGWDAERSGTVEEVDRYYDSMEEIYENSDEALDAEVRAVEEYLAALKQKSDELAENKKQVTDWLKQLNDPHESALRRIADNLSAVQEKTRAVLESNNHYHKMRKRFDAADKLLQNTLKALAREQNALLEELGDVDVDDLPTGLADRIGALDLGGPAWLAASPRGPQSLIIKKSGFARFLGELFGAFTPESAARDIVRLREELLNNPLALAQLLPNTRVLELGDDPDGFYLVYSSQFSTPHGLETASNVTLGNVLRLWDSNVSVVGHRFVSPPNPGNAPYGDQGITVRVETLEHENFVNYLDVTFHRFIQDAPEDLSPVSQAKEDRMLVFDDFALMLAGDKLYFGAAGFADFALDDTKNKPYYYGGNFKASVKFNEIMSLTAEESVLFAKDPRRFLQTINLDFTGYDPGLDEDFVIDARGEEKRFRRDKVGVELDLQKALETADSFRVDFFLSRVTGTDDIEQTSFGSTIVKGFAFEVGGVPVRSEVSGTGELGTEYNTVNVRTSFELPEQGIVLSGQGKILGDAKTYLLELRKRFGDSTEAFISWGSPYVGLNHRLTVGVDTVFTLGQLWRAVAGNAAEDLLGGKTLEKFNKDLADFFEVDDPDNPLVGELKRVFETDVGRKLVSLEIGRLTREIAELRKAGAFLDNTRVRGMVGFVSNPVGDSTADRAAGGGFQAGTQTELSMTKTQKAVVENRVGKLFAAGLSLQVRLLDLTRVWQETVAEILEARWERELAVFMAVNAPDETLAREGGARVVEAEARLHQARLRYNLLTGRPPEAELPFEDANPQDLDYLMAQLGQTLSKPERLSTLLRGLDPSALQLPEESFNLMDWVPWIENLTFWVGVQLQDLLANQVLGAGVSVRIPVYDPHSPLRDKALILESEAVVQDMLSVYGGYRLRARQEEAEAAAYDSQIAFLKDEGPESAKVVADAIRAYRNGLIGQDKLWAAFRRWHWTVSKLCDARARAALKAAWALLDREQADAGLSPEAAEPWNPGTAPPIRSIDDALTIVEANSPSLESLAKRSQAVSQLLEAASNRIEKVAVDLNVGVNITAAGVAWIPALGITGLGFYPIVNIRMKPEELRGLQMERHQSEGAMYDHLRGNLSAELGYQFVSAYAAYMAGKESLAIYEGEILPGAQTRAVTGGQAERLELARIKARIRTLRGQQAQLLATLNYLLGRPAGTAIDLGLNAEEALGQLVGRYERSSPLDAKLGVLRERVRTARAVETIVDKNLKLQELRIEPISLIGRSLGRLVAALSGSGDPSPELVALARHQTLEAEQALSSYEKALPALRARLRFELDKAARRLGEIRDSSDPEKRLEASLLRNRILQVRAQLAMAGGAEASKPESPAGLPGSFAELANRLISALRAETPTPGLARLSGLSPESQRLTARGTLRYFDARMSIGKDPIGEQFLEGWIEVRLKSRTTPPETLVALAGLQKEKADQIHAAAMGQAESTARMLLARLRLNARLLRWAESRGPEAADFAGSLRRDVERDLDEIAAHLGIGDADPGALLALLPKDDDTPQSAARDFLRQVREANINALRRTLFQRGLPSELAGSGDAIIQLKANVIAERMSYKGFTPVGLFGMFRGKWVAGAFLEAPDPNAIQKGLEAIIADALRVELESQDRLKGLALKLHSLMASVADKARLLEAQQIRLESAQRNLSGLLVELERGMASQAEADSARKETAAAWRGFMDTLAALRMDFIHLVVELKALGLPSRGSGGVRARRARPASDRRVTSDLARYLSRRLLDPDFERRLDELFDGKGMLPDRDRADLVRLVGEYRLLREQAEIVRNHIAFDGAERLDLLTKADVEGRRLKLEAALRRILERAAGDRNPGWKKLHEFFLEDIRAQAGRGAELSSRERSLLRDVEDAYWDAGGYAPEAAEIYDGLRTLRGRVDDARQDLLESYLQNQDSPEGFLLKDMKLDEYLKRLIAYDEAVVRAFSSEALRSSRRAALSLDGIFSLRESVRRRRALLRHGRGILAVETLLRTESAHLDALLWERAGRDRTSQVSQRISFLRDLRERWIDNPRDVESVLAVVDTDSIVKRWLTRSDLKGLERAGRVISVGGKRWLIPAAHAGAKPETAEELSRLGALEIMAGLDAMRDELDEARRALSGREAAREVADALKKAEFVLVGSDGRPERRIGLAELRKLEAEGRVLYFSAKRARSTGLRRALHAIEAMRKAPDEIVVRVTREGTAPPPGRYASLEALEASEEASKFLTLKTGILGAEALMREARAKAELASKLGWISLKLEAYAFALDAAGNVAAVFMSEEELRAAQDEIAELKKKQREKKPAEAEEDEEEDPRMQWRLHLTRELEWGVAADGTLASVRLPSVSRGSRPAFERSLGGKASRWITGDVLAVELDAAGALVRVFQDQKLFKRAAAGWWIEDMRGRIWQQKDFRLDPTHRMKRYIDPETKLPVLLGWKILNERLEEVRDELGDVKRWAYMPWNWHNIILETPRGIIKTPIEVITGRDPNQHGYIGRVYMYRTDGGATVRRGALGKIVHFLDIFELLPDPVDRYMDPSQFPDEVVNDSPLLPGEWEHEKDPRTDDREIHFGSGSMLRFIRYAAEDMEDARGRILGAFQGGVRQTFVETVRGRAGTYSEARVRHQVGRHAVDAVLGEAGDLMGSDGTGVWEVEPGHIEVDRVSAEVQVRIGADQHLAQARAYKEYLERIRDAAAGGISLEDLRAKVERLEEALIGEDAKRKSVSALSAVGPPLQKALERTVFPYYSFAVPVELSEIAGRAAKRKVSAPVSATGSAAGSGSGAAAGSGTGRLPGSPLPVKRFPPRAPVLGRTAGR